jgi:uncharacterized protein YecT (DUF1311 family)
MSDATQPGTAVLNVVILFVSLFATAAVEAQTTKRLGEEELGHWINKQFDCPPDPLPYFSSLDYYDFKGDGNEEAIVVASTCETGTAGPDVHSVIGRDASGNLIELKIPEADNSVYDSMFGNSNSELSVENGLLVETFNDDVGRDKPPLVLTYKWNGHEFAIVSIKKSGVFRTSYDCAKAGSETENAICHVKELADLDLELGSLYRSALATLTAAERSTLRAEQREWIAKRDRECPIYKGWVGCLSACYEKRIDELKKRYAAAPAHPHP